MKLKHCQNIFHVTVNASSIVQHVVKIKNRIIKHVNMNVKIIKRATMIMSGILAQENSKYLKSIVDTLVIAYDQIISVMDIASTKMTNTLATNVAISCHNKKERY